MNANQMIESTSNSLISRRIKMVKNEHDRPHKHPWHQLILARNGTLKTCTPMAQYYVPQQRGVLIPSGCVHESWAITEAEFIGIYFDPKSCFIESSQCYCVELTPLFRELVLELLNFPKFDVQHNDQNQRLVQVFFDLLKAQTQISLEILLPKDKRLNAIVNAQLNDPASNQSLSAWAKRVGASERTLSRLFIKETGQTFRRWRQKVKMVSALSYLAQGRSIQEVAMLVGYDSTSAFIQGFKQVFNKTPQRYF